MLRLADPALVGALFSDPGFLVPFALLQVLVLLLSIWFVDFYERESLGVVALIAVWGATAAPAVAIALRQPVLDRFGGDDFSQQAMVAALVEEPAKGVALVLAFLLSTAAARHLGIRAFDGVTDGAVFGAAVGLGFAFTENLFFLVQQDSIISGLEVFAVRTDFGGVAMLQHAIYSGAFGAALGYASWQGSRVERVAISVGGLALAIFAHALHNGLVANGQDRVARAVDYGFVVLFALSTWYWLNRQRAAIEARLSLEVADGLITDGDVVQTARPWKTLKSRAASVLAGDVDRLRDDRQIRRELVDLAFAADRHVVQDFGDDSMSQRRARIRRLVDHRNDLPNAVRSAQ